MITRNVKVTLYEIAIMIGLGVGYLATPRSFPLLWYLGVAACVFVLANLVLLNALKNRPSDHSNEKTTHPGIKRLRSKKIYLALALFALYLLIALFWH